MSELFIIEKYSKRSAEKAWSDMSMPVGMLRLFADSVHDISGESNPFNSSWIPTSNYHFQYLIGFRPQPDVVDGNWSPRMSFKMGLKDFSALHLLMLKIKEKHEDFLQKKIIDDCHFLLSAESEGLCFEATYTLTKFHFASPGEGGIPVEVYGNRLRPLCTSIDVFIRRGNEKISVGHLSFKTGFQCMAGLILEAERMNAFIEGKSEHEVTLIQQIDHGPVTPFAKLSLYVVKAQL